MISLRLAVVAVLVAAAVAWGITLYVTTIPLQPVETDQRLPSSVANGAGRPEAVISTSAQRAKTENHIEAFERAAEAILKNAKASAGEPPVSGPIPLPRRRPILAP